MNGVLAQHPEYVASNELRFLWFIGTMNHNMLWLVSPIGAKSSFSLWLYKDAATTALERFKENCSQL